MKRVKVYVPVILQVLCDDNYKLEVEDNELEIIEQDAINSFESGDYVEVKKVK
jgi:hypothetical protein